MTAPAPAPRQDALDLDVVVRPVEDVVAELLARIASDPGNAMDRERVVRAVLAEGRASRGRVDQNRVRARLADPATGELRVKPQLIGAVISGLVRAGALHRGGWGTNDDRRSRNSGKPLRLYVLAADLRSRGAGAGP